MLYLLHAVDKQKDVLALLGYFCWWVVVMGTQLQYFWLRFHYRRKGGLRYRTAADLMNKYTTNMPVLWLTLSVGDFDIRYISKYNTERMTLLKRNSDKTVNILHLVEKGVRHICILTSQHSNRYHDILVWHLVKLGISLSIRLLDRNDFVV